MGGAAIAQRAEHALPEGHDLAESVFEGSPVTASPLAAHLVPFARQAPSCDYSTLDHRFSHPHSRSNTPLTAVVGARASRSGCGFRRRNDFVVKCRIKSG